MRGHAWTDPELLGKARDVLLAGMFYLGDITVMDPETLLISCPKDHFLAWMTEARETLDKLECKLDPELEGKYVSKLILRPGGAELPRSPMGPAPDKRQGELFPNGPFDL